MQEETKLYEFLSMISTRVFPQAFSYVAKVRHVQVDAGYRIKRGSMAQLPTPPNGASDSTVISLQTRVFCRCYALRKVLAPGCKQFGAQVFEECCSLIQIGIRNDATNQPAPQAELMPRAFEKCTALRQLDLEQPECNPNSLPRCLPECCFLEAGLISLTLPPDFEPCWSRGRLDMLPFMPPPLEEGTGQATRVALLFVFGCILAQ